MVWKQVKQKSGTKYVYFKIQSWFLGLTQFSQMLDLAAKLKYDYQSTIWKEDRKTTTGKPFSV